MFAISRQPFKDTQLLVVTNSKTGEFFSCIPERGAQMHVLTLSDGIHIRQVLETAQTPEEVLNDAWYHGSLMIPFVNRIEGGTYSFEGSEYQLPINKLNEGHAMHGFFYAQECNIEKEVIAEEKAEITLRYEYDGTYSGFPFPFIARIIYVLSEEGFSCRIECTNTGNTNMPFGAGWHPYFSFKTSVDECALQLPSKNKIIVKDLLPTGELTLDECFLGRVQIGDTVLDACFALSGKEGRVETIFSDAKTALHVWQETGRGKFNYLQVYIPPWRTSLAIEPQTAPANSFNNGLGTIVLAPCEKFNASLGVSLRTV